MPTLYNSRNEARRKGILMPDGDCSPEAWVARDKFAAVLESASLNEEETAEYCRRKSIYPEQLTAWRKGCEAANDWDKEAGIKLRTELDTNCKRIKDLEKELQRKEKALTEAAALLVLQKRCRRPDRCRIIALTNTAFDNDARLASACQVARIDPHLPARDQEWLSAA